MLRLSSISQNLEYEYTVRPRKKGPWNKGMLWPNAGVYDCSHNFMVKNYHHVSNDTSLKFLQSCITEQHCFQNWMLKFICSTSRKAGNPYQFVVSNMAKGKIKPFWGTKPHDLCKLWILFDKFVIYITYFAQIPHVQHVPIPILLNALPTKAWPWRIGALSTLHDQHMDWWWAVGLESGWGMAIAVSTWQFD